MCRKPSQHSSHLLPSHSPELHQQSHSLTSCTDNPMPLVHSPTKIQKCYKLFRFGAGQLQVNPLSILLGCSSLVMLESAPWCSCLGLPAKPRKELDALNSTIQMENSMENTTSLSTSSLELVLRWRLMETNKSHSGNQSQESLFIWAQCKGNSEYSMGWEGWKSETQSARQSPGRH